MGNKPFHYNTNGITMLDPDTDADINQLTQTQLARARKLIREHRTREHSELKMYVLVRLHITLEEEDPVMNMLLRSLSPLCQKENRFMYMQRKHWLSGSMRDDEGQVSEYAVPASS